MQRSADELRQLLNGSGATPEQIKTKLAALRQARETHKKALAQARAQLQQVLTVKQEAQLVLMGLLNFS